MEEFIAEYSEMLVELGTTYGLNIVFAILILIIGLWIAGRIKNLVLKACKKSSKIDDTLGAFFSSLARYVIIIFTVLAVLDRFGVETASLIAILGAASLAIGLALQGTLSNVAAGVMLLIFRPFKVGQFVDVAGHAGTVKHLGLFVTEMATGDNVKIIIPNGQIWGASIKNFSANDKRRVDLVIGIGYDDDIDKAIAEIGAIIDADARADKDPDPSIFVGELGASSVDLVVRVWTDSGNYWPLKADLTKAIKQTFDEKEISFPYPQQDVHIVSSVK
ncbi:mechanosensitive ion channel family protein [Pseudemcibacter aquimaris]|uniref:mechanosensitive ion channel family protein n=1 Tax=Pseudemcibacter aquimaris TaxID=2857064 RepID=UPI0020120679|nr:mechanosensitive ion channel domain-containing protein [Pseudemcibacter aquimaris]MCC3860235.1 mechanosensitive ion channel [Pseudemcibacter aquimaris]WDU57560.1 mechanosensitive ion channel [Pseudemcibacter aquimaris]